MSLRAILLCVALLALVACTNGMNGRRTLARLVKRADAFIETAVQVSEGSEGSDGSGSMSAESGSGGSGSGSGSATEAESGSGSGSGSGSLSGEASGSFPSTSGGSSSLESSSLSGSGSMSGSGSLSTGSFSGLSTGSSVASGFDSSAALGSSSLSSMSQSSLSSTMSSIPGSSTTGEDPKAVEDRLKREIEERVVREREADWARQRKDLEEQGTKKERLLQLQMVDQLKKARAEAEQSARRILADAKAKATEMLQSAKPPVNPDEERKRQEQEARNAILLKPVPTGGDDKLDPEALGLAPTMSLDTNLIRHANGLTKKADIRHDRFEDKHEIDCKGPICEGHGSKVQAEGHI